MATLGRKGLKQTLPKAAAIDGDVALAVDDEEDGNEAGKAKPGTPLVTKCTHNKCHRLWSK